MKTTVFPILLIIAFTFSSCHKKKERTEELPQISVAEAAVDSVTLTQDYPGTVIAKQTVNVVARVNGMVTEVAFADGSFVKKGDVLFRISDSSYRAAVERAQAALNSAQSQYSYYSKQYDAMNRAFAADAVSKMEVLQAEANMQQARAAISTAKAELENAKTNLGYCTITAPISGFVTTPQNTKGNTVYGEGSPVVMTTIYDNSGMLAIFYLSDSQYESLLTPMGGIDNVLFRNVPLKFREKLPHSYFTDLYYSAPNVDSSTGTIKLQGSLPNYDNELKDGMFITVSLPVGFDPQAILVKNAAISTDQRGEYLYTVNDSDKVVYTPIKTGQIYRDTLRVVTSGIKPGEKYVTKALLTVRPGEKIKPVLTK